MIARLFLAAVALYFGALAVTSDAPYDVAFSMLFLISALGALPTHRKER